MYRQFIVANATRTKNIKIPNKVTEVIYCHCKAAASIMRATVLVLSLIHTHHHLDISATDRAAGAIDESIDTSSTEPRVAARDKCDAISLPDQTHLTAVLSAGAGGAGDVEVVAVAAAGDAVAAGWSSASSSSLMDASWRGCRASVCAPTL